MLTTHEAVYEAGVIGVPDRDGLTRPKAFLVLKPGVAQDLQLVQALRDFVAGQLPSYKCPHWIEFVDRLPKTATGKLRRYLLRKVQPETCGKIGTS